jgi:hypothetical protein
MAFNHYLYTHLAMQHLPSLSQQAFSPRFQPVLGKHKRRLSMARGIRKSQSGSESVSKDFPEASQLSLYYAKALLQNIFGLSLITRQAVQLYAAQLFCPQRYDPCLPSQEIKKRALIISDQALEHNLFSALLRSVQIMPVHATPQSAIEKYLKQPFDMLIASDHFPSVDAHAIAQIVKASAPNPLLVMVSDQARPEHATLGVDVLLQHPFSCETFAETLKQFFSLQ